MWKGKRKTGAFLIRLLALAAYSAALFFVTRLTHVCPVVKCRKNCDKGGSDLICWNKDHEQGLVFHVIAMAV